MNIKMASHWTNTFARTAIKRMQYLPYGLKFRHIPPPRLHNMDRNIEEKTKARGNQSISQNINTQAQKKIFKNCKVHYIMCHTTADSS